MGKLKPLKNLKEDAKDNDLVRLVGSSELEATGYYYGYGNQLIDSDSAYLKYSPKETDVTFHINLNSGICSDSLRGIKNCLSGHITNYEILRRHHPKD